MQTILAWLRRQTEGERLLQWVSYTIIFVVLVIFTIDHPKEIVGWRFYGTILALALLLVGNILWSGQPQQAALAYKWPFLILSGLLLLAAVGLGELYNAIYMFFMLCAQATLLLGIWPSGLLFIAINLLGWLGLFKLQVASTANMVSFGASLLVGTLFILLLVVLLERFADQTRRAERLLLELQAANAELEAARQKERELAIAEERVRLARDIHDGLGHHLTVLSIQLQAAGKLVERNPQAAAEAIQLSRSEAQAALEEVRRSVAVMRQSPAESQPLPVALEALIRDFDQRAELSASFEQSGEPIELSPYAHQALFRAAQEGLTNAQKHGKNARHAWVRLEYGADAVRLSVRDDGQADEDCCDEEPGFGLAGLRERLDQLGGTLRSGPGEAGGFEIEVCLPLGDKAHDPGSAG